MTRRLVLMGSGETAPTMVEVHKRAVSDLPPGAALVVDTPYGFQENADELTSRAVDHFRQRVGLDVEPMRLRAVEGLDAPEIGAAVHRIEQAAWVFAGPGSPTYLQRQWEAMGVGDALRRRVAGPGVTILASAAACVAGARTLPVYDIYKVGADPHWRDGLDLTGAALGLSCVVIPHFDNAEGGTHDTRFCYMGDRRLQALEALLPDDTWILGIDEHTALIIDLDTRTAAVEGRGAVTVRVRGRTHAAWSAGTPRTVDQLATAAASVLVDDPDAGPDAPSSAGVDGSGGSPLLDDVERIAVDATAALAAGDAVAAAEHALAMQRLLADWQADPTQSDATDRARGALDDLVLRLGRTAQAGLHDHTRLVAPLVDEVLAVREAARAVRDWARADHLRDVLAAAGVDVEDTPDGPRWSHHPPA